MFTGPAIDDEQILARLPEELRGLLKQGNGYVAYHGGLHLRGACREPAWHSLRHAWEGDEAIHRLFDAVLPTDVPFAEDVMGDQFVLRDGIVHRLFAETGELQSLGMNYAAFEAGHLADPVEFLNLQPLLAFRLTGGEVDPGILLIVYPPFCTAFEGERRYGLVPVLETRRYLSELARQLSQVPDEDWFRVQIT